MELVDYKYSLFWHDEEFSYYNFIQLIFNLYESVYFPQLDTVKCLFSTHKINTTLHHNINEIEKFVDNLKYKNDIDFQTLYTFANFVKVVEKLFCYKNDSTSRIVCDNKMQDKTKVLVFKLENTQVKFTVYKEQEQKIVKVHIYRDYGKHMESNYRIEDGIVNSENNDDILLMDSIGRSINYMMASFMIFWANVIVNKDIDIFMIGGKWIYEGDSYFDNSHEINMPDYPKYRREEKILEKKFTAIIEGERHGCLRFMFSQRRERYNE